MGLQDLLRPRQSSFFTMLLDQAQKTREGLEALEQYMQTGEQTHANAVIEIEKQADEQRRILIDELNRNFVTPIDREDIFALSRAIDDVVDYARSTVDEMAIFGVQPNDFLKRLVGILREAADELHMAVGYLQRRPTLAGEHAQRAKVLENQAEQVYREALADLFKRLGSVEDVIYLLKMREIYRHLSNAADRGDECANIIGDIVVKMT